MTDQELRAVVLGALGEVAPDADLASLAPDDDLRERLDIDSMDHLNFVIALHQATGVEIPERDYARLVTLRDTVAYLSSLLSNARA